MRHAIKLKKIYCKNVFSKAIGLRFHKKIIDKAYIFILNRPQIVSLDMVFVHFPIDVIFLDERKKVIDVKENFKPYSMYRSKKKTKTVIELPQGYVKNNKIKLNDDIKF